MDPMTTVGDVTFSTGSVQTVRQVHKLVVRQANASNSPVESSPRHTIQSASTSTSASASACESDDEAPSSTCEQEIPLVQIELRELLVALRTNRDAPPPLPIRTRPRPNNIQVTEAQTSTTDQSAGDELQDHVASFNCCDKHGQAAGANDDVNTNHKMVPVVQCSCCPFGYHIAVDFADLASRTSETSSPTRLARSQMEVIRRRSEQLARTRELLSEHAELRARSAIANANIPPSPNEINATPLVADAMRSQITREIDSALDVSLQHFTNGACDPADLHAHSADSGALDCPVCVRRVPIVSEEASNLSKSATVTEEEEVFEQTDDRHAEQNSSPDAHRRKLTDGDAQLYAARCAALETQLNTVREALRHAEEARRAAETKLAANSTPCHVETQTDNPHDLAALDLRVRATPGNLVNAKRPAARRVYTQTEMSLRNVGVNHRPCTRHAAVHASLTATRTASVFSQTDFPFIDAESESESASGAGSASCSGSVAQTPQLSEENVAQFIRTFASAAEKEKNAVGPAGTLRALRAVAAHLTAAEFQALFRAAFRRETRHVEMQVAPRRAAIGTTVDRRYFQTDVSCGDDDKQRIEYASRSAIGVQCRPELHNKLVGTQSPIKFDVGSLTRNADVRNRASQTEMPTETSASSSVTSAVHTKQDCQAEPHSPYANVEHQPTDVRQNSLAALPELLTEHQSQQNAEATPKAPTNDRQETFVARPAIVHRIVSACVPSSLSFSTSSPIHSSTVSKSTPTDTIIQCADSEGSVGSLLQASTASGLAFSTSQKPNKSILKKSCSKPETPVGSPLASPMRPKKSISFAAHPLVVGSTESSLSGEDAALCSTASDETQDAATVDSSAVESHLEARQTRADENQAFDDAEDDELDDEDKDTRVRNTAFNAYSAYADMNAAGTPLGASEREEALARELLESATVRPMFQLPCEVRLACQAIENWLEESHRTDLEEQLEPNMAVIATEWFRVATEPHRDAVELLEDYLRVFNDDFSSDLLERVVRLTDSAGNTAMHYAVWKKQFDVIDLLLSTEACDCDALNAAGYSCIMLAAECRPLTDDHCDVLRRLFESGDVNKRTLFSGLLSNGSVSNDGSAAAPNALFIAAAHGEPVVVRLLLECGADIGMRDADASTALHWAVRSGHVDSVTALLVADADVNSVNVDGCTPLHLAAERGDVQVVRALLAHSQCDCKTVNSRGLTPLEVAKASGHLEIVSLIQERIESESE